MTIKEVYEFTVNRLEDIDQEIATLKGRRDVYNEMRGCLYSIMEEEKRKPYVPDNNVGEKEEE